MTRAEFSNIVKGMKAIYTDPKFIPDGTAMEVWYALFKGDDYQLVQTAVQRHMLTVKFPPTPAEIREQMVQLTTPKALNEEEAWQLVIKAVRNSNYNADEEFAKLPESVQRAVASPTNLRELAMMPTETVNSVEKSHFFRVYRTETERAKETAKLPESIRTLIAETGRKMISG